MLLKWKCKRERRNKELIKYLTAEESNKTNNSLRRFARRNKRIINRYNETIGANPLFYCLQQGYFAKAISLLQAGVDVNVVDMFHNNALHILATSENYSNPEIVYLMASLLGQKVDGSKLNIQSFSPFDIMIIDSHNKSPSERKSRYSVYFQLLKEGKIS